MNVILSVSLTKSKNIKMSEYEHGYKFDCELEGGWCVTLSVSIGLYMSFISRN